MQSTGALLSFDLFRFALSPIDQSLNQDGNQGIRMFLYVTESFVVTAVYQVTDLLGGGKLALTGNRQTIAVAQNDDCSSQRTAAAGLAAAKVEVHFALLYLPGRDHIGISQSFHLSGEHALNNLLGLGGG